MFLKDFANGVEILVKKILGFVETHPLRQQRASPTDDSGNAIAHQRQKLAQHARVDGHVIHALLGLLFDHFEHHVQIQVFRPANARERFVDRYGADGHRRRVNNRLANHGDIAAGGQVHHRVRAVVHSAVQFFELFVNVRRRRRISDVRVDLAEKRHADAHGLKTFVVDVSGNDGAAARNFAAHELGRNFFALGNVLHLFGDDALARKVHLREISWAAVHRRRTLLDPRISDSHSTPVMHRN